MAGVTADLKVRITGATVDLKVRTTSGWPLHQMYVISELCEQPDRFGLVAECRNSGRSEFRADAVLWRGDDDWLVSVAGEGRRIAREAVDVVSFPGDGHADEQHVGGRIGGHD